jgi:hypothetical protein
MKDSIRLSILIIPTFFVSLKSAACTLPTNPLTDELLACRLAGYHGSSQVVQAFDQCMNREDCLNECANYRNQIIETEGANAVSFMQCFLQEENLHSWGENTLTHGGNNGGDGTILPPDNNPPNEPPPPANPNSLDQIDARLRDLRIVDVYDSQIKSRARKVMSDANLDEETKASLLKELEDLHKFKQSKKKDGNGLTEKERRDISSRIFAIDAKIEGQSSEGGLAKRLASIERSMSAALQGELTNVERKEIREKINEYKSRLKILNQRESASTANR